LHVQNNGHPSRSPYTSYVGGANNESELGDEDLAGVLEDYDVLDEQNQFNSGVVAHRANN
jgi:hypothetical protein